MIKNIPKTNELKLIYIDWMNLDQTETHHRLKIVFSAFESQRQENVEDNKPEKTTCAES